MQSITDRKITQSVVLTGEQITKLQELSKETGKSLSSLARDALTKFFQAQEASGSA